jgi:hypothetical protein
MLQALGITTYSLPRTLPRAQAGEATEGSGQMSSLASTSSVLIFKYDIVANRAGTENAGTAVPEVTLVPYRCRLRCRFCGISPVTDGQTLEPIPIRGQTPERFQLSMPGQSGADPTRPLGSLSAAMLWSRDAWPDQRPTAWAWVWVGRTIQH